MSASDPGLARALAMYRGVFAPELERGIDATRRRFADMTAALEPGELPEPERAEFGGVPALVAGTGERAVVWFHSGGYVLGSSRTHLRFATDLAAAAGCRVIVPDYRLAPEHPFPAAPDDASAVLDAVIDRLGAEQVVVGGDSAGGALTLVASIRRRDRGLAGAAAMILLSPLLDLTGGGLSMVTNAERDPAISAQGLRDVRWAYLQGHDPRDPQASPLHADLGGLPRALVLVGGAEALLDDSRQAAAAMNAAGGRAVLREYPDMCHAWPLFGFLDESRAALGEMADFVGACTSNTRGDAGVSG
ncbi:alpha/beta hydrolase [Nocardia higoensis]|uniref:alpha/beta hydrolase n=1 Tax=Nocardia higoensis TaxID=228599 RepID=UPI000685B188|nr:alpha/beta hydrolase [Nocardia higoensis]